MKPLIFLDIDGVLNRHEQHHITKYCSINRNLAVQFQAVLEIADAEFVLSSAWRYLVLNHAMTLQGLRYLFNTHWIDGSRLIGVTRPDTLVAGKPIPDERGKQISDWLNGERRPYVVIDDGGKREDESFTDLGISTAGHPFVLTQSNVGLSSDNAVRAIKILKSQADAIEMEETAKRISACSGYATGNLPYWIYGARS